MSALIEKYGLAKNFICVIDLKVIKHNKTGVICLDSSGFFIWKSAFQRSMRSSASFDVRRGALALRVFGAMAIGVKNFC